MYVVCGCMLTLVWWSVVVQVVMVCLVRQVLYMYVSLSLKTNSSTYWWLVYVLLWKCGSPGMIVHLLLLDAEYSLGWK